MISAQVPTASGLDSFFNAAITERAALTSSSLAAPR